MRQYAAPRANGSARPSNTDFESTQRRKSTQAGIEFGVGSGFTDEQRNALWASKESLVGKLAKVKFFEVGIKEAPRFPVFLGFRSEIDL